MSNTTTNVTRHECDHCVRGFRGDYEFADHYGEDTPANRACENGVTPCPAHRCYYAPEIQPMDYRRPEITEGLRHTHVLADAERHVIAGLVGNQMSTVGQWLEAIMSGAATVEIVVTRRA